ncbi:MAG: hypothetical protein ABEJ26_06735 [Halosimplex sp.]
MPDIGHAETPDDRFWSALNVGALSLVAAATAVVLHAAGDAWPAGAGGRVALGFALAGAVLVGYAAASRLRSRDAADRV